MNLRIFILIGCIYLLEGCSEFIEPSLDGKSVALLAPGDQQQSSDTTQIFLWEAHPDALYYRLQIAKPEFENVSKLVLDTIIVADKFKIGLKEGQYQWRVRPENGSSKGKYTTNSFTIIP